MIFPGFFSAYPDGSGPPTIGSGGGPEPSADKNMVYLYGDVAQDGTVPSGGSPYHQMLLTTTGQTGLSEYAAAVATIDEGGVGVNLTQQYATDFVVTLENLSNFDLIHFGCHQRIWTSGELAIFDDWIRNYGGSVMFMADSAAGGAYFIVGAQNTMSQDTHNPFLEMYGMQYYVDQSAGNEQMVVDASKAPEITGGINKTIEGEGVSPVKIYDANINAGVWAGYGSPINLCTVDFTTGGGTINHTQNVTFTGDDTLLAYATPGLGQVLVWGDRQFFWNDGSPGADITFVDNLTVILNSIKKLVGLV